ncbi:glutamate-cysteine ligase family protein [Actinoplanes sp. NEAU-A12]|uniref:Glutamate-cysteine ligase family protein n=1 Tax=Actinoplanes sandaracinus TaxID=3045177 RepID=A0ABT6WBP2_9ACTN|nr:glutamate-cysteine ligase family protein [Actinoplanes sandaracinus]MDI6097138.1 glutamate-cysteine ligase family protein [Actinoplanes sandaracinus]
MGTLNEQAAEEYIAARAFTPGVPGFVGIAVDLLVDPACAPSGRRPLRHGFLDTRSPRILVVSGPPSPGLEVALRRMGDDLDASARIVDRHRLTVVPQATGTLHPESPAHAIVTATAGIRVGLEAGLDGGGPLGLHRRWGLAHMLAPVLAAAFANAPLRHGRPTGWRSVRQALRRDLPLGPVRGEPQAAWAAYVMDTPAGTGSTPRQTLRAGGRLTPAELNRHLAGLRPPVAARGHLELDVADRQAGNGWRVPAAVTAVLLDDPRAAEEATEATARLAGEPALWERAARDALTDPALAAAARDCFMAAYAALSRQGVSRELRDAVADFIERYVCRNRCPADDVLDGATASP